MLLDHALKVLLYQPRPSGPKASTPLQAAAAAAAPSPSAGPAAPTACPGLSLADMRLLEDKGAMAPELLPRRKAGLLGLLAGASAALDPKDLLLPLLAGACDPSDLVSK